SGGAVAGGRGDGARRGRRAGQHCDRARGRSCGHGPGLPARGRGRSRRPARRADRGARDRRGLQSRRRPGRPFVRDEAVTVSVNGGTQEADPGETVESLLDRLGLAARYALVERNGEPVERGRYGEVALEDGDTLVVARPVAGG